MPIATTCKTRTAYIHYRVLDARTAYIHYRVLNARTMIKRRLCFLNHSTRAPEGLNKQPASTTSTARGAEQDSKTKVKTKIERRSIFLRVKAFCGCNKNCLRCRGPSVNMAVSLGLTYYCSFRVRAVDQYGGQSHPNV